MNNKDIYELLNDIEFDITSETEMPMDDIQRKRIKKKLKSKIKSPRRSNRAKAAIAACLALIVILISPMGRNVVAKITEALFFNPGLGLVNKEEDIYVLKEPIEIKVDGDRALIKSVLSKKNSIQFEMWIEHDLSNPNEKGGEFIDGLKNNEFSIKLPSGEIINSTMYGIGVGGRNIAFGKSFETEGIIKEFSLLNGDKELAKISLIEPDKSYSYDDVGGNYVDKGIRIGGNKYYLNGETYLSLWDKDDKEIQSNIRYPKEDFTVLNNEGKSYKVDPSNYSGQGNEFVIEGEANKPLNIRINKVEVDYYLKNMPRINVKIPKKGETIEVNEEIYIGDIDEKILLKSVKRTEESVELYFDLNKFKKEDSQISLINASFRNHSCIGSRDNLSIVMNFDYKKLNLSEKITGKLDFNIGSVGLIKEGKWNFTVE